MKTRDGKDVEMIDPHRTPNLEYGLLEGNPAIWFNGGKYRMDDKEHPLDIVDLKPE